MKKFEIYLIYLIVMLCGYEFAVPVNVTDVPDDVTIAIPFWASKLEIFHGVYLRELLFFLYLLLYGLRSYRKILFDMNPIWFSLCILGLGIAGILSAVFNFEDILDILEALRLFVYTLFFLCLVYWARNLGANVVLKIFLFGALVSTIVNLYFTFVFSWRVMGILPVLLGQNGPGGALGFMISFGAWLFLIKKKRMDAIVSILFTLFGIFAVIISYSKLGMLMAVCGVFAWIIVLFKNASFGIRVRILGVLMFSVVGTGVWLTTSETGNEVLESIEIFYYLKFGSEGSGIVDSGEGGDQARTYYYFAVAEIFAKNPLFGVSYSGFMDAVLETDAYRTGNMEEEENREGANPHNAFLYYISANGIIGWTFVILLFSSYLWILLKVFIPYGTAGIIIWGCFVIASMVHTNTLPSFFNTSIMYVPAAIAFSISNKKLSPN